MTYVCITGNENDPRALQERLDTVLRAHARLLCELRLDYLDLSPGATFSFLAKLPSEWAPRIVLTQRLRASGVTAQGRCGWDLPTWQSWWKDVMSLRPWFAVDLDWIVLDRLAGEGLSWQGQFSGRHAFFSLHAPLDELEDLAPELASSARAHGAGVKIAAPVRGATDLARLTRISDSMGEFPLKTTVAMGAAGKAWRWSQLAGSLSYFSTNESLSTALGQDTLENVLPYLESKKRPDLYLLWSTDPDNKRGETRWNELFHTRGTHARYLNVPCTDVPATEEEEKAWAADALLWMSRAGVKGASITRPFKRVFAQGVGEKSAINTLRKWDDGYESSNTDGEAVAGILEDHGLLGESVAVLGGGGAAQAVQDYLVNRGVMVSILRRGESGEPPHMHKERVLISTWPGHNQQLLVEWLKRCAPADLALVIDAQFSVAESESPLALWCEEKGVHYVPGGEWWHRQALGQDRFWFDSKERWGKVKDDVLNLVPRSKSITLRALAIAAVRGGKTEIRNPSICGDTLALRGALQKLGVRFDEDQDLWIVTPPARLKAPDKVLDLDEGATGFRILLGMASQIEGSLLKVDAAESLRKRPHDELFSYLQVDAHKWPLEISLPAKFPEEISAARSSQFATSFLIAAAGEARRSGTRSLRISGNRVSEPYLKMTEAMLMDAGFSLDVSGETLRVSAGDGANSLWEIDVEHDASALSFLRVIAAKLSLELNMESELQGDAAFSPLLRKLRDGESDFPLTDHPDLAPPLVAAALLFHKDITIRDCPHLKLKECDRIHALGELARSLGVPVEEFGDGLRVQGSMFRYPRNLVAIKSFGDHRIAMAAGVLGYFSAAIANDEPDCVKKSFPKFWEVLRLMQGVRP